MAEARAFKNFVTNKIYIDNWNSAHPPEDEYSQVLGVNRWFDCETLMISSSDQFEILFLDSPICHLLREEHLADVNTFLRFNKTNLFVNRRKSCSVWAGIKAFNKIYSLVDFAVFNATTARSPICIRFRRQVFGFKKLRKNLLTTAKERVTKLNMRVACMLLMHTK